MPDMRTAIAVLCGDIHARHSPPLARGETREEWYEVQKSYYRQLKSTAEGLPIIVAGDVFHHWDSCAELINFMLANFPVCYAVPGQHDLPNHNLADIKKSAYWTLTKAGRIANIHGGNRAGVPGLVLWGFPWGEPVKPMEDEFEPEAKAHIAIIHDYIWKNKHDRYPGASGNKILQSWLRKLGGYDAAVFGDNHKAIIFNQSDGTSVINCGTFIRQKSDEKDHKPHVGILYDDGMIERKYLDTSADKWRADVDKLPAGIQSLDADEFLAVVQSLTDLKLDYDSAVKLYMEENSTGQEAQRLVLHLLEDKTHG